MNPRFFFDQCQEGYWYKVNDAERALWHAWKNQGGVLPPEVAEPLTGHPRHITFEQPYERA